MSASMVILAVGGRTPVGLTAESSAAAVRAGIARLGRHPFFVDARGDMVRAAVDARLEDHLLGWERIIPLLKSAISEAMRKLVLPPGGRVELLLSLPEPRPGFSDGDANRIAHAISQNYGCPVEIAGRGHAGALLAAQVAAQRLAQGGTDFCVVAGADSYFIGETLDWLDSNRQLAREDIRSGFTPGEAAGALVVATESTRRRFRLGSLASCRAVHTAAESNGIKSDRDGLGIGLSAAVSGAATSLRLPDEAVDAIFCDINGESYRSEEWGLTVLRISKVLRDFAYHAPSSLWGDVGAASGALGCILAVQSWARNWASGPRALVWGSSEGGLRGAAILEQPVTA